MTNVTGILAQMESGDQSAAEQLLPLVYAELRKLAAIRLASEKPGHTLQATALVHDAYLRLVDVDQNQLVASDSGVDLIALDEVLQALAVHDARKAELVRLRYFAGLTSREAAEVLGISESTADADWAYARSWLRVRMHQ